MTYKTWSGCSFLLPLKNIQTERSMVFKYLLMSQISGCDRVVDLCSHLIKLFIGDPLSVLPLIREHMDVKAIILSSSCVNTFNRH